MAKQKDDDGPIEEAVGITLGLFAVAGFIAFLIVGAGVALLLFGIGAGAYLLWKKHRYSPAAIARREVDELRHLHASVKQRSGDIEIPDPSEMAATVVSTVDRELTDDREVPDFMIAPIQVATDAVLEKSGLEPLPEFDAALLLSSVDARNTLRETLYRLDTIYRQGEAAVDAVFFYLCNCVGTIVEALPRGEGFGDEPNDYDFTVEIMDVLDDAQGLTQTLFFLPWQRDEAMLTPLQEEALARLATISQKPVADLLENPHKAPHPKDRKGEPRAILLEYLGGSPWLPLLKGRVAYRLPPETRFEHMHILAGTGHGKTQLIQRFVREDLTDIYFFHKAIADGGDPARLGLTRRSLVVIDGQGEMIENIARRALCSAKGPLKDKVILIDPTDTEYPLALNMFDIGQAGLERLDPMEREMIFNGTIELYVYLFGALLSAELTQKQNVLFRYLARLMLAIPNARLDTLRDVLENGEAYQPYIDTLDEQSQAFFRTQFFGTEFKETKKQVLRRLWGIISIQPLANMFNSPRNKISLFDELQDGRIILINTAKDFLKTDGSRIFGRFWIAMIAQAALRRAAIHRNDRVDTHVYIDEAHEYVDDKVEEILNQARKYRVGMHLAHQNLDQLSPRQRATFGSSTGIKMVGGVSDKDARAYAGDLRTPPDGIMGTKKRSGGAEFMTFVRNHTDSAITLNVGFGTLERMDDMGHSGLDRLRDQVRENYATQPEEQAIPMPGSEAAKEEEFALGGWEGV